MRIRTDLEYSFEPPDFFEAPLQVATPQGILAVDAGRAILSLPAAVDEIDGSLVAQATKVVHGIFRARQLLAHRTCRVTGPGIAHTHDDGRRDVVLLVEGIRIATSVGSVDLQVRNAAGDIVSDTKAERAAEHQAFLQHVAGKAGRSAPLDRMLSSYAHAVADPEDELVHLYEIVEVASAHFGGENAARTVLGVSKTDWKLLTRLANNEPVRQGRHRGKQPGVLRDATPTELTDVRRVARHIIGQLLRTDDTVPSAG